MTSIPASRSARQTTFTPRSCPSSPTLPIKTRMRGPLVDGVLNVASPFLDQRVHDLAAAGVSPNGLDGRRHEVGIGIARHFAQRYEGFRDGLVITLALHALQLGDLPLLDVQRHGV